MAISRRHKITIASLVLYWPAIFTLTHIPLANAPAWVGGLNMPDKIMHFIAYVVLVFLIWFTISPNKRVNWRRAPVWWVLLVIVWYGAIDEWLQGYVVGRDPNVMDFYADLAGALTGLALLTFFAFWPACLAMTGALIFVMTNFIKACFAEQLPIFSVVFHLLAYGFFTLAWTRYLRYLLPVRAPAARWLIAAVVLPVCMLAGVTIFCAYAGNKLTMQEIAVSAAAIGAVVGTICAAAMARRIFCF